MIKVFLVDDSKTALLALRNCLERDPEILVVGEAQNGSEALRLIKRYNPDLVTMDVYLTEENGLDIAAQIMAESARPIIVVTGIDPSDPRLIYKAMQRGVLDVFPKLPASTDPLYESRQRQLINLVRNLSQVPVIHQIRCKTTGPSRPMSTSTRLIKRKHPRGEYPRAQVLLIGASTGGPPVVCELLRSLPKPCPIATVVVQHISEGFGDSFVKWLSQATGRNTVLVDKRTAIDTGTLYVAPDSRNIVFSSKTHLDLERKEHSGIKPSIDLLFNSAARFFGPNTIGVLLTGMGVDGSNGLSNLIKAGALTMAQSPDSCVVDSMPRAAIALNAATKVMPPNEISFTLRTHLV